MRNYFPYGGKTVGRRHAMQTGDKTRGLPCFSYAGTSFAYRTAEHLVACPIRYRSLERGEGCWWLPHGMFDMDDTVDDGCAGTTCLWSCFIPLFFPLLVCRHAVSERERRSWCGSGGPDDWCGEEARFVSGAEWIFCSARVCVIFGALHTIPPCGALHGTAPGLKVSGIAVWAVAWQCAC